MQPNEPADIAVADQHERRASRELGTKTVDNAAAKIIQTAVRCRSLPAKIECDRLMAVLEIGPAQG